MTKNLVIGKRRYQAILLAFLVGGLLLGMVAAPRLTLASIPGGQAFAWGFGLNGELGNDKLIKSNVPVNPIVPAGVTLLAVSGGGGHSMAIGSDGQLYTWGNNSVGQIGNGTKGSSNIVRIMQPISLPGGVSPVAISAGGASSMAIGSDGQLYAWGDNSNGQLGDGSKDGRLAPVAIKLPGGVKAVSVAVGANHTLAIGSDHKVYAWGFNQDGELGNGTNEDSLSPVEVKLPAGTIPVAVASGLFHSLALTSEGKVYAWGLNNNLLLGADTDDSTSNIPVQTVFPEDVKVTSIAAGEAHNAVRTTSFDIFTWGVNAKGQLGDGTFNSHNRPTKINLPNSIAALDVSANNEYTVATGTDGKVYTWGNGGLGTLGNGTFDKSAVPVQVLNQPAGKFATAIAAGDSHVLAIYNDSFTGAHTTLTLVANPNPALKGQPITLNVTVGQTTPFNPTGTLIIRERFPDGESERGFLVINGTQFSLTIAPLEPGKHTLLASYSGDSNYRGTSSELVTVTVLDDQPIAKPTVVTGATSNVTPVAATLNGTVNANNSDTTSIKFEFGKTANLLDKSVNAFPQPVKGKLDTAVSANLSGLTPDTTYYYELVATNAAGTGRGGVKSFRTAADATNFNLFVLEDLKLTQGGSEITGKVAAGRDVNFNGYNLATGQTGGQDNLLAGRNLALSNGQVKGNAVFGGSKSIASTGFIQGSAIQRNDPLEVAATKTFIEGVSNAWKNAGGQAVSPKFGGYQLQVGAGTTFFKLKGSELANANNLQINAPAGATVILNIDGVSGDRLQNMGIALSGGIDRQHVVYNFYEATSLSINSVGVQGSVLAPQAVVTTNGATISGSLVAKSVSGGSTRFENFPFAGQLPL